MSHGVQGKLLFTSLALTNSSDMIHRSCNYESMTSFNENECCYLGIYIISTYSTVELKNNQFRENFVDSLVKKMINPCDKVVICIIHICIVHNLVYKEQRDQIILAPVWSNFGWGF